VHGVDKAELDVSDSAAVSAYVKALGRVDVLVNCAGGVVGQVHSPIEEVSDQAWQAVVDANLTSTFVMTRAVVPGMKAAGWGRIVNISSGAGRSVSLTGIQAYTSAKAGQIGFTRQLAHELGPHGITVNCIAPGFVLSNPSTQKQWESYGPEGQAKLVEGIALRRTGTAADIAGGVRYFTSEWADWVSGQVLSIDGGSAMF
jgi:3-oxoacyl-[acyl-carrier protein] reductase